MNLENIICYGAGSAYHWVEEVLEKRFGCRVLAIIDQGAPSLQSAFRCPLISPDQHDQLRHYATQYPSVPVIITLGQREVAAAVAAKLTALGFQQVVTLNAVFEAHLGFQSDAYPSLEATLAALQAQLAQHLPDIARARAALADAASQQVFDQVLSVYVQQQGRWVDSRPTAELQFPPQFLARIDYGCVVRCGVALDEMQEILAQDVVSVGEFICIEPDIEQFQPDGVPYQAFLSTYLPRSPRNADTVFDYLPAAAYSRQDRLPFLSVALHDKQLPPAAQASRITPKITAFGSRVGDHSNGEVDCVTLDAVLLGKQPSLIIADAEGAELEILKGAQHCILSHHPTLVMAAYHQLSHLWELINFVSQLTDKYEYYLVNYTGFVYETFLYALPVNSKKVTDAV